MAQRSDYIRQDIESTRASLDEKLDSLETKARQTFDLNHQVSEHPWMMVGAAVAAGYVLGSLGGGNEEWYDRTASSEYNQYPSTPQTSNYSANYSSPPRQSSGISSMGGNLLSQFDDEISMLKTAAITTLTNFLRDSIREYVPALGQQLDHEAEQRGKTRSTAPNTSTSYSGSTASTNYEGIPETTSYGSNVVSSQSGQGAPYYPPGSSASSTSSDRDYVKTYHSPTETGHERSVGDEKNPY